MAIEREWTLLRDDAHLAIRSDRRDHLPYGLFGGLPGSPSNSIRRGPGGDEVLPTMISTRLAAGESLYHRQPAGGGWGDPLEREPELVARDVRNGKVSQQSARDEYGVVLADGFAVLEGETDRLRSEIRASRG